MTGPAAHLGTDTPVLTDVNNGAAITTGVRFTVDATKTCDGISFYVPATNSGTYTVGLYQTTSDDDPGGTGTGTELATASIGSAFVTSGTWATVGITPQTLSTGTVYTAARHASSGRYVATSAGLSGAITRNGVTLLAAGTDPNPPGLGSMTNGVFTEGASLAYPNSSFGNADYFADISLQTGQSAAVATATETDTAQSLARLKTRTAALAAETDTAVALTRRRTYTLPVASETDMAPAVGQVKARALAVAVETDVAQALTARRTLALAVATEVDTARALGKVLGLLVAVETDSALPVSIPGVSVPAATHAVVVSGPQRAVVVSGAQRATVVGDG